MQPELHEPDQGVGEGEEQEEQEEVGFMQTFVKLATSVNHMN